MAKCIYCKSTAECEHLFAVYDIGFDSIEAGILYDNPIFEEMLIEFFREILLKHSSKLDPKKIENDFIRDLYIELIKNKEVNVTEFDLPAYNRFIFHYLNGIIKPIYFLHEEGAPGTNSGYNNYYSLNIERDYSELTESIKKLLQNEKFNLDSMH